MWLARRQLEEVGLIDTSDPYTYLDNEQSKMTSLSLKDEVVLEVGDKYIQALINMAAHLHVAQLSAIRTMLRETSLSAPMTIPS